MRSTRWIQRAFKTEPLYPPVQGAGAGFITAFLNYIEQLWNPIGVEIERLGDAFGYDEDGSPIGKYGMGGANSTGSKQYVYLPTASGPRPVARCPFRCQR